MNLIILGFLPLLRNPETLKDGVDQLLQVGEGLQFPKDGTLLLVLLRVVVGEIDDSSHTSPDGLLSQLLRPVHHSLLKLLDARILLVKLILILAVGECESIDFVRKHGFLCFNRLESFYQAMLVSFELQDQ